MARKRFNRNIVASSDAYKVHSHLNMLKKNHEQNVQYFEHIQVSVHIKKTPYVKIMGKFIPLTEEEVELHSTLDIIRL